MNKPLFEKVVIIGVGLIGGSLAKALVANQVVSLVVGVDQDTKDSLPQVLEKAEVIILAVPPLQMEQVLQQISPFLVADMIITDVCSAKQKPIAWAKEHLNAYYERFVPAHPIAGSEKSGASYAGADLFQNKRLIITPTAETNQQAIDSVSQLWQRCGAVVTQMSPQLHDFLFAWVSHLPHVLAFALLDCIVQQAELPPYLEYVGAGFRDFTRIGRSNPVLWQEICAINREEIIQALTHYQSELAQVIEALRQGDDHKLLTIFKGGNS